jgi:glycosyltransferase involved in cell wall biosynthesis
MNHLKNHRIRVLFTNLVDTYNYNAQSLNVREIALRLDPERFQSTLFYERTPDPRLVNVPYIRLIKIPPRLGTFRMLAELIRGQDILFRANLIRFTYLYLMLPKMLRKRSTIVEWEEGPSRPHSIWDGAAALEKRFKFVQARISHRVSMTSWVAETNLQDYGLKTERLIPVGVDTRMFTPPASRDNPAPIVLFVGTLIKRKGPHVVLMAAKRFHEAKFVLVGARRGDFYLTLMRLIKKWNLTNVEILDPLPHSELAKLMQKSDIMLHPSKVEGMPKILLEGGATGLPGLVFDYYHTPSVVDGVNGFQVRDYAELMEKLGMLIENRDLRQRMGQQAITSAKEFDWDVIVRQWEDLFKEVARAKRRPQLETAFGSFK